MQPKEELLQRVLDDECTPEERQDLERQVAADPQLRRQQLRLIELDRRLRSLRQEQAPAELMPELLQELRESANSTTPRTRRPQRDALFFAAGIAAMLLVTLGLNRSAFERRAGDARGSLLPAVEQLRPIRLGSERVGEVGLVPTPDGPLLQLRWSPQRPATMRYEIAPSGQLRLELNSQEESTTIHLDPPQGTDP